MSETKKRRYPRDAARLHELRVRLENEIAERQEMLTEVRKLETSAENSEIVNMVRSYNVTPEEFGRIVGLLRDQLPGENNLPHETVKDRDEPLDLNSYEIETEENEDE